jgi:GNAT superfamily N-acetyltransferase
MSVSLRLATKADVPEILSLVQELAIYEKAPEQVTNTLEKMEEDGFGPHPIFQTILAETPEDGIVGMSLYYYRYSTWKGKRLYLEDLIVREKFRGFGYGKLLFNATVEKAKETNCTGMMWQVLDWNKPAIDFYKTYGTRFDSEWLNCHLDF